MKYNSYPRTILDIETNGLLDHLIDFKIMPFKFKPSARLWTIVLTNKDDLTQQTILRKEECTVEAIKECLKNTREIIFHNGIKYDAVALQLFNMLEYSVYYEPDDKGNNGTFFGKPLIITDTLVLSKILNPDRFFGHSLESWGRQLGDYKTNYREVCIEAGYITKDSPKGAEFAEYHEEIIPYCVQDTVVTGGVLDALIKEKGRSNLAQAYHAELKICDLTIKQELYGFAFDADSAKQAVQDFTKELDRISSDVNPILPSKRLNKGDQKDYIPPTRQFKANGDISAFLEKFVVKIGATLNEDNTELTFEGKTYTLPLEPDVCLKKEVPSTIDDLDNLKSYLLDLGWNPIEWKERDLTKDSKKKKLDSVKFEATVARYVANTLEGDFKDRRLEMIGVSEDNLYSHLMSKKNDFSIRVPVSPCIRVGTEKKLCPNLEELGVQADFVKDVVKYLTLKHRKNSISGGVLDEDGAPSSGYISLIREDGRVSTPADTIGASTARYRHIGINL